MLQTLNLQTKPNDVAKGTRMKHNKAKYRENAWLAILVKSANTWCTGRNVFFCQSKKLHEGMKGQNNKLTLFSIKCNYFVSVFNRLSQEKVKSVQHYYKNRFLSLYVSITLLRGGNLVVFSFAA